MDFSNSSDDFFVNINVQTTMRLPSTRETILHFFELVQKEFPTMSSFFRRETGEYVLEGNRESGNYQWVEIHNNRFCAGFFNPPDSNDAKHMHSWLLERSPYYLGMSGLDVEAIDVLHGFNLDYTGNRDMVVADAILSESPLSCFLSEPGIKPIEYEPNIVFSLDEECCTQARVAIETRCNSYQVRTGQYEEEPISVYFTIRGYPQQGKVMNLQETFVRQFELCEDFCSHQVVPQIVQPIAQVIATAQ
ncbi:MAG: hypothetical protein KAR11_04215 [Phycisphaerae bacterium]|nr:hypothetical protein [Phycisphaerae bacterium]